MRHSKIDLTMNVYTDPRLLDVSRRDLDALPNLPIGENPTAACRQRATGTDDRQILVAPTVGATEAIADNL